ncbi:VTT domain-containing protein [Sinomonas sp. JGH33]|uniref:VTT domain-containing protein n=1 Tax=Sinomonas terricola TaxID=3110330 RepID=A0ABU5T6U6_9MICC|nr:VTT domain-containing protein [Sinomonas sp. JGH33]MEA5455416.1 VTT domain-containing protein [Sinomonas sp. JGH33]
MEQLRALPFEAAVAALFAIVFLRTNGTYWLGRALAAGYGRTSLAARWNPAKLDGARRLIDRWGPVAILLTFVTVGLQTAVNLAAGAGRMSLRYYIPATAVGSLVWALLYATVGLAAVDLVVDQAAASPWAWVVVAAAGSAVVLRVVIARRRRQAALGSAEARVDGARDDAAPDEGKSA